jgi:hypothetical protein
MKGERHTRLLSEALIGLSNLDLKPIAGGARGNRLQALKSFRKLHIPERKDSLELGGFLC